MAETTIKAEDFPAPHTNVVATLRKLEDNVEDVVLTHTPVLFPVPCRTVMTIANGNAMGSMGDPDSMPHRSRHSLERDGSEFIV
jgi:hypothetical protein